MQLSLKNTHAYRLLERERRNGGLSHAYLVLCADGGILRDALIFFARCFFTDCDERTLSLLEKESFSDCLIFPKPGKKLSVEDAAMIVEEAGIRPLEGKIKLFLIDRFQDSSPAFQNKLLKILEEPPQGVCFLLGATTEFSLLPTVLSRVKKLELPPFSTAETEAFLRRNFPNIPSEEISFFSSAACGKLSSATDMIRGGSYKETLSDALTLCFSTTSSLAALSKKIGEKKEKTALLSALEILFRDAAFVKAGKGMDAYLLSPFYQKEIKKLASSYSLGTLLTFQEKLRLAEKQVKFNAYFPQCVQLLFTWLLAQKES